MASERQGSSHVGAQSVLPLKECLTWNLENNIVLEQDDRNLLQRWLDDDRASEVWSTIRAHSEQHNGPIGIAAPIYFIIFVLTAKKAAERENELNAKAAAMTAELKKLQAKKTSEVDREAKKVPFEKRADVWERAGKRLRLPPLDISRPRVRSDRNGSRARTYFMREISGYVRDLTGRWLDEQVATITEIAFDKRDIDVDTVRKARSE